MVISLLLLAISSLFQILIPMELQFLMELLMDRILVQ
jgi:hypothetical protein